MDSLVGRNQNNLEAEGVTARREAVDHALLGQLPLALSKATRALELNPREPSHYLLRGILRRRSQDFPASIEDLVRAVELGQEPGSGGAGGGAEGRASVVEQALDQLVLAYNDFGVHCSSRGLQAEATLLLDRALQEQGGDPRLYLNRAGCLLLQGRWRSAVSDCQRAEDLNPGDRNTRAPLAALYHRLGVGHLQHRRYREALQSFDQAVLWDPSRAIFYEDRSRTLQLLRERDLGLEDAMRTLVLDPGNQQVVPLVQSGYPGCTAAEVMSGPDGAAVRSRLLQTTRRHPSASGQPGICTGLETMALANESADKKSKQSLGPCDAEDRPPLVGQSNLQELVTQCRQTKKELWSFLSRRPPLHHSGPSLSPP